LDIQILLVQAVWLTLNRSMFYECGNEEVGFTGVRKVEGPETSAVLIVRRVAAAAAIKVSAAQPRLHRLKDARMQTGASRAPAQRTLAGDGES